VIGITEFHTDPGARDSARQEVVEARSVERIAQDEIHEDEEALCTTQSQVGKMNREEAMAEVGMNRSFNGGGRKRWTCTAAPAIHLPAGLPLFTTRLVTFARNCGGIEESELANTFTDAIYFTPTSPDGFIADETGNFDWGPRQTSFARYSRVKLSVI